MANFEDTFNNIIEGMMRLFGLGGAATQPDNKNNKSVTSLSQPSTAPVAAGVTTPPTSTSTPVQTSAPATNTTYDNKQLTSIVQRVTQLEKELGALRHFVNQINDYLHEQNRKTSQNNNTAQNITKATPQVKKPTPAGNTAQTHQTHTTNNPVKAPAPAATQTPGI